MTRRGASALIATALALVSAGCTTSNVDSAPTTPTTTTTLAPPTTAPPTTIAPRTTSAPTTTSTTTSTTVAATTTTVAPGAALVLASTGIGRASFGADPDGVIDYVTSILGAPAADSGWADPNSFSGCSGTVVRAVSWDDLTLFFGDGPSDGQRREFFGHRYGTGADVPAAPPGPAIDGGITVGTTVRQLRQVYPSAGINPESGEIHANFTIVEGLSGYLTGVGDEDIVIQVIGGLACGG